MEISSIIFALSTIYTITLIPSLKRFITDLLSLCNYPLREEALNQLDKKIKETNERITDLVIMQRFRYQDLKNELDKTIEQNEFRNRIHCLEDRVTTLSEKIGILLNKLDP